jgi:hypothetical protein
MIAVITDSDPHMMIERVWNNHCDTKPQDPVRQAEGVDIPIAQEQDAGGDAPHQGDRCENWVRKMSEREKAGRRNYWQYSPW